MASMVGRAKDLIWEQHTYPVELKKLLEGNSYQMILEATLTNDGASGIGLDIVLWSKERSCEIPHRDSSCLGRNRIPPVWSATRKQPETPKTKASAQARSVN